MEACGQILMSEKALSRLQIIEKLLAKQLNQKQAADLLHIGPRQVRRPVADYKRLGPVGLNSNRYGKPSNNQSCQNPDLHIFKINRRLAAMDHSPVQGKVHGAGDHENDQHQFY